MIQTGDSFEQTFSFSQDQVRAFAEISGDHNPVHVDEEAAKAEGFPGPIVHGILSGSIFSRILGNDFPGPGTVYLKQKLDFRKPLLPGVEYKAIVKVIQVMPKRHIAELSTEVVGLEGGRALITGQAMVMNRKQI
ncbi:MAG: MaoC family dehydratase [Bacteroidota bacterium]